MTKIDELREFLVEFHTRYPGATAEALKNVRDAAGRTTYEAFVDTVVQNASPDARILELGCGDGIVLAMLAERLPNAELTGVDAVSPDIEIARRRVPSATLLAGDFTTLPFPVASYQCIIAHLVLMLSGPLEPVLEQVERALTPGGAFLFVADDVAVCGTRYSELIGVGLAAAGVESATRRFADVVDKRLYDEAELRELLLSHRLSLETVYRYEVNGALSPDAAWELFSRMYPIGTLAPELNAKARRAIEDDVRSSPREVNVAMQLVTAKRLHG
jgi:SAM-dependent methyltransferase